MPDITRTCLTCGNNFSYEYKGGRLRIYCSERCAHAEHSARQSARKEALKSPRPTCRHCDVEMERRLGNAYCGAAECQRAKREATKPPRPRCRNCGKQMPRREDAVYCDARPCRSAKYRASLADRPRCSEPSCTRPVIAKGLCGSHYKKVWLEANPGRAEVWHTARRARVAAAFVEDVPLHALLERDGWMCGICGKPIPRDAVWPDRQSPSLDHVIPLSKGGEHSWANAQAAHLSCNSRKGASILDVPAAVA